jgi:hypothetical protein
MELRTVEVATSRRSNSYEGLENLAGCRIHNVRRIVPQLQDLQVGDLIRLGPKGYPCFRVWALEPERSWGWWLPTPRQSRPSA